MFFHQAPFFFFFHFLHVSTKCLFLAPHRPWIQPLLQAALIPFIGEVFRNQDLGITAWFSLLAFSASVFINSKHTCVYQHVCMCLYFCVFLTAFILKIVIVSCTLGSSPNRIHFSFFPFLFLTPFSKSKTLDICCLIYLLLTCSVLVYA